MKDDLRKCWTLAMRYAEIHTNLQRQLIELAKHHKEGSEEYACRSHTLRVEAEAAKQLISQTYTNDGLTDFGKTFLGIGAQATN